MADGSPELWYLEPGVVSHSALDSVEKQELVKHFMPATNDEKFTDRSPSDDFKKGGIGHFEMPAAVMKYTTIAPVAPVCRFQVFCIRSWVLEALGRKSPGSNGRAGSLNICPLAVKKYNFDS